eukprot:6529160-Pyramimonas_sp.AAC.1
MALLVQNQSQASGSGGRLDTRRRASSLTVRTPGRARQARIPKRAWPKLILPEPLRAPRAHLASPLESLTL